MVVKRFIISISVLFFYALLLQAKNIIARDMGANKGDVPANIAILDSDSKSSVPRVSCSQAVLRLPQEIKPLP